MAAKFDRIEEGREIYVVAELSANHGQDFEQAVRIIEAAKKAGADAIKTQTYTADTLTLACDKEYFRIGGGTLWDGKTLHDLYQEAFTPWEWQPKLKKIAEDLGMDFFSAAFDPSAVDFLEELQVPFHKVASPEIVDIPLIKKMASTGKPLFISTGMATEEEIQEAVDTARQAGTSKIALLKCTSAYPAPFESMNLRAIPMLKEKFQTVVGLSDHSLGTAVPVAAVAVGAQVIEKHITLSRATPGPDSAFSLEPYEFKQMVDAVRIARKALGAAKLGPEESEKKIQPFRRSLFFVKDVKAGEVITSSHVRSIRPGHGLSPRHLEEIIGSKAKRDVARGTPVEWEHLET